MACHGILVGDLLNLMFLQKTCFDKIQCQSMWESLGVTYRLGAPIWLDCQTVTDVPTSPLGPTGAFDITDKIVIGKNKADFLYTFSQPTFLFTTTDHSS